MTNKDEVYALFYCKLLNEAIFEDMSPREVQDELRRISSEEVKFPDGKIKKPSFSTLNRKLKIYREKKFLGLTRKLRNDLGKSRKHNQEVIDYAVRIKKDNVYRSDRAINVFLKSNYNIEIPKSTLYHHLKINSATKKKMGVLKKKVRCCWTADHTNDLWQIDYSDGPKVIVDNEIKPTQLVTIIDQHSCFVIGARYFLSQDLEVLIEMLLRSWEIHGSSKKLYTDNAKTFASPRIKAGCLAAGTQLFHRPVREPEPGGKIERVIMTIQVAFETEVKRDKINTIDYLNKSIASFINVFYHENIHAGIAEAPKNKYESGKLPKRPIDIDDVRLCLMKKVTRVVNGTFSDIGLCGRFYKVSNILRKDKVIVRWDPYSNLEEIYIYSISDQYIEIGTIYNREKEDQIQPKKQTEPLKYNFIELLNRKHEEQIDDEIEALDYSKINMKEGWSFNRFLKKLASLLGRKGGQSSFNKEEHGLLMHLFIISDKLTEANLLEVWNNIEEKNLVNIVFHLQQLFKEA